MEYVSLLTPQGKLPPAYRQAGLKGGGKSGEKLNSYLIRFDVPVAKDKEVKVKYRIRFKY